ncbi:hypothetical protein N9955_01085 [bacterium]|nr:hypothetical protein [bacterium]
MKDPDEYEYEINEYKRKLNIMSEQVKVYEKKVNEHFSRIQFLEEKLKEASQDALNIRGILTKNITESNQKIQDLLAVNQELKTKISGAK